MKGKNRVLALLTIFVMLMTSTSTFAFAGDSIVSNEPPATETTTIECTHEWGVQEFTWGENYSCTVSRTCTLCDVTETANCSITRDVIEATCSADGEYTYTATSPFDGSTTQTWETITSPGHTFVDNQCTECGIIDITNSAPTVTVKTQSLTKIKVSWTDVPQAEGYYVYRSTSGLAGSFAKIQTLDADTNSFIDTGRTTGKTYYYKVKAFTSSQEGAFSAAKSGKAELVANDPEFKKLKSTITVKTYSMTKIKVSWTKVNSAKGYYVYRATSKNGTYKKIKTTNGTATSFIDTNRTPGKTYYYKVRAYAGNQQSAFSAVKSGVATISKPNTKLICYATGSTIKISWKKVISADGYYVYRKKPGGSWTKIDTIKGNSTFSYKDSPSAGSYYYSVKAYTYHDGKKIVSARSEQIKTRTLKTTSMSCTGVSNQFKNKLKWNTVKYATGYEIYQKKGDNGKWTKLATVGKVNAYTTPKVTHGWWYYYKIRPIYKSEGYTTKGNFSNVENRIHYYYPNVSSWMSSETQYGDCSIVFVALTNNGVGPLTVYNKGAKLLDADYYSYDRDVQLVECETSYFYNRSYITIPKGETVWLGFEVKGSDTWYDKYTDIKFKIKYDGIKYWCYCSAYYGFYYYEID